ncbi:hypothetical protein TYRP_005888 [Tyrophagus putrescentiae]|nr:hypothetical protein TYRP_005888 [Tyrophagus putrescentiae]
MAVVVVDFRKALLAVVVVVILLAPSGLVDSSPVNRTTAVRGHPDKHLHHHHHQPSRNFSVVSAAESDASQSGPVQLKKSTAKKLKKSAPVLGATFPQTLRPERQTNSTTVNEFRSAILTLVVFIISVLVILSYKLILFNRSK